MKLRWCTNKCGKKVVYSPDIYRDTKPFKCLNILGGCGKKHSYDDLGIKPKPNYNRKYRKIQKV